MPVLFLNHLHITQVARIEVLGMHCSACSTAVETALGAKKGVQEAKVSLTLKMAEVTYDPQSLDEVRARRPLADYSHLSV